jgi:hypothetical protein
VNRWRYVTYVDDGVYRFQCLFCKNFFCEPPLGWGWNTENGAQYCPYCGTKWEGQLKRKLKRWEIAHDKWDDVGTNKSALWHFYRQFQVEGFSRKKEDSWIIETRTDWGEDSEQEYWHQDRWLRIETPASQVIKEAGNVLRGSQDNLFGKSTILRVKRGSWISKEYVLDGDKIKVRS